MRSCQRTQVDCSVVVQHLKYIGKVKKFNKLVPDEQTTNKKISLFWSVIFSYSMQQQQPISWLDCDVWWKVDFIQVATINSVARWRSSKALPVIKLPRKKGHGHWWSVASLIHYSFLNPGKPLHQRRMLNKLMRGTENGNSWASALVNRKCPILLHDNTQPHLGPPVLQKLNELGCEVLPHPPLFTWPFPNWLPLLQASWQLFTCKMLSQPAGGRNAVQDFMASWSMNFYTTGTNTLISHWQEMCWL